MDLVSFSQLKAFLQLFNFDWFCRIVYENGKSDLFLKMRHHLGGIEKQYAQKSHHKQNSSDTHYDREIRGN